MDEFLMVIAKPLARLLDAAAGYVERATPDDQDDGEMFGFTESDRTPVWQLDARGEVVRR